MPAYVGRCTDRPKFPLVGTLVDKNGSVNRFACVGAGWYSIIRDLDARLAVTEGYNFTACYTQIKEKFGELRVYTGGITPEGRQAIRDAEELSYRTCEICGAPGAPRQGGWIQTLCDKCAKGRPTFKDDEEE